MMREAARRKRAAEQLQQLYSVTAAMTAAWGGEGAADMFQQIEKQLSAAIDD